MVFQATRDIQGGLWWGVITGLVLFVNYVSALDATWRSIAISIIPAILASLRNNPYFVNVKTNVVVMASVATFFYMTIIQLNNTIQDAMDEPQVDTFKSGLVYSSIMIFFIIAFMIVSRVSNGSYQQGI